MHNRSDFPIEEILVLKSLYNLFLAILISFQLLLIKEMFNALGDVTWQLSTFEFWVFYIK